MAGISLCNDPEEMTTEFAEEPERAGCDNSTRSVLYVAFQSDLQKNPKEQGVTT